jgi:hypothetical protein
VAGVQHPDRNRTVSVPEPTLEITTLVDELREENRQLRELVIQLSKLVVKNVLDGH